MIGYDCISEGSKKSICLNVGHGHLLVQFSPLIMRRVLIAARIVFLCLRRDLPYLRYGLCSLRLERFGSFARANGSGNATPGC